MQIISVKRALICLSLYTASFTAYFANAESPKYGEIMMTKAAEEFVAAPVQLLWTDMWEYLVHKKGNSGLRKLRFLLSRGPEKQVTLHVLKKLKEHIFNGQINPVVWNELSLRLFENLHGWWNRTPEDPLSVLELGVWQALVQTHKDFLGEALKGSPRVGLLHDLIFDADLELIKSWVNEYLDGDKL